ncbi:hypothetical protein [Chryseobacterium schmidteae]|uniref:hypothetical protein n=1 Tax=Chryseobacterium schmidteae TaxID=2730404 RepID=UPI001589D62F|nr:hypothetical protein [Chryseobacterium schmidteae]
MNEVIESLLVKINNHEKITNSVLGKTSVWKNNHYEILSQIINDTLGIKITQKTDIFYTLGNSVSSVTLKRLYKNQIKPSAYNDLRFTKTLDKLCIFLDYANLNHFISETKISVTEQEKMLKHEESDLMKYLKAIVDELCEIEFTALRDLSNKNLSEFDKVLVENTPYIEKVKVYRENLHQMGAVFLEKLSNYEVYNYKMIYAEENNIVLETEEFWNINFKTPTGIFPFHKRATQTYYLKNQKGKLKIWDNYNPDIGEVLSI